MGAADARGKDRQAVVALRERVRHLDAGADRSKAGTLPFGLPALDDHLPGGGLALGALHEIAGDASDAAYGAGAALFAAGLLARLAGPVLWSLSRRDLFAPALAGVGLHPDRVLYVEAGRDERTVLLVMEEGLRCSGLAGIVGEVGHLGLSASRRLQLAAEGSGVVALALRRARDGPVRFSPNAAQTRWRITALPASRPSILGLPRARWQVDLLRCRGGEPGSWILEACDAKGRLALAADLADGPVAAPALRAVG